MEYKTGESENRQTKVIVVPIEEIHPGIEDRYRRMLEKAKKQGTYPIKPSPLENIK